MSNSNVFQPTGFRSLYYELFTEDGTLHTDVCVLSPAIDMDGNFLDADAEHIPGYAITWDGNLIVQSVTGDSPYLNFYAIRLLNSANIIVPERFIENVVDREDYNNGIQLLLDMVLILMTVSTVHYLQFSKQLIIADIAACLPFASYWLARIYYKIA